MHRIDSERRMMLDACGFTYDPARDAYAGLDGRMIGVDTILAHTEDWLAQWITQMRPRWEPAPRV